MAEANRLAKKRRSNPAGALHSFGPWHLNAPFAFQTPHHVPVSGLRPTPGFPTFAPPEGFTTSCIDAVSESQGVLLSSFVLFQRTSPEQLRAPMAKRTSKKRRNQDREKSSERLLSSTGSSSLRGAPSEIRYDSAGPRRVKSARQAS